MNTFKKAFYIIFVCLGLGLLFQWTELNENKYLLVSVGLGLMAVIDDCKWYRILCGFGCFCNLMTYFIK